MGDEKPRRLKPAATLTPNPEIGLTAVEREVRRELLRLERPISAAAIMIAGLRAALAEKEPPALKTARRALEYISDNGGDTLTIEDAVRIADAVLTGKDQP